MTTTNTENKGLMDQYAALGLNADSPVLRAYLAGRAGKPMPEANGEAAVEKGEPGTDNAASGPMGSSALMDLFSDL